MTTLSNIPVSTQGVRADDLRLTDEVWFEDWCGHFIGGPVRSLEIIGDDVEVEVTAKWGAAGDFRRFTTSQGNIVQVAARD